MATQSIIEKINAKAFEIDRLKLEMQSQVAALQERIASGEAELEKLKTAAEVLLRLDDPEVPAMTDTPPKNEPFHTAAVRSLGRTITKRERILTAVASILKAGAKQTDDLIDDLASQDVVIAGDDRKSQIRNLSAYLSRAKEDLGLQTSRLGWSLINQNGESPVTAGLSIATMSQKDEL